MNKKLLHIAILSCTAGALPLHAQNVLTNGDLERASGAAIESTPDGWISTPFVFDPAGIGNPYIPAIDTLSTIDQSSGLGLANTPHSGSTFVSGVHHGEGVQEVLQQEFSLVVGQEYELSFWQAVIKESDRQGTTGTWLVYLNGTLLFTPENTQSDEAFDSLNHPWEERTTTFTAEFESNNLRFAAYDDDGTSDSRMGIDTISLTQVPEPSSLSLLALGSAALLARRKR